MAGVGYGAEKDQLERFRNEAASIANNLENEGIAAFAETYAYGPTRVENKDPRGFAEFKRQLAEHSAKGSANTQRGVQRERPSIFDLEPQLKNLRVPTLILNGDEDWPCLLPGIFMKRTILSAGLLLIPNSGHAVNIEEPDAFNAALASFLAQVDSGGWPMRDPRAMRKSITGITR